jgi:hypothetical protein
MNEAIALKLIDTTFAALSAALNFVGASQTVSAIIAARIADGGREWTDDERAAVQAELVASKAYAATQIAQAAQQEQP